MSDTNSAENIDNSATLSGCGGFINKQIIHITAELIVLAGLIYFNHTKHKKIICKLRELEDKLNDKDIIIQKQQQTIDMIIQKINTMSQISQPYKKHPTPKPVITPKKRTPYTKPVKKKSNIKPTFKHNVNFDPMPVKIEEIDEEYSSDSDLDAEIELELKELEEEESSLKKN